MRISFAAILVLLLGAIAWLAWSRRAPAPTPARDVVAAAAEPAPPTATALSPEARTEVAAALPPIRAPLHEQRVRCLDERGAPVAGAKVRLLHMPHGSGVADLIATSDADGVATFADVPAAYYLTRASLGARHYAPVVDRDGGKLPAAPFDVVLEELWIGGLELPGAEVCSQGWSYHGFRASQDRAAEQQLIDEWKRGHPGRGVVLFAMFRDPRRSLADTIPVTVLWVGHELMHRDVRLWPASQFQGPELLDPSSVPSCDWATVRVVLTDAADQPLPEAQQAALRQCAQLQGGLDRGLRGPDMSRQFRFASGTVTLPCGAYELQLFDSSTSQMRPVRRCVVARDTTGLRFVVPSSDRVLRLHLRGLANGGYMLQAVHENGRKAMEFGRADGEHLLLLPPGLCTLTLHRGSGEGAEVVEHAFAITADDEQQVTWNVPPGR
jgi:hypothetical protein